VLIPASSAYPFEFNSEKKCENWPMFAKIIVKISDLF